MAAFVRFLLLLLPLCAASAAFLPLQNFLQGNKERTAYRVVRPYSARSQGKCAALLSNENVWDTGMQFAVHVANEGDADAAGWRAVVTLSKPVDGFTSYDGKAEKTGDATYTVENVGWNGDVAAGKSVKFNVQIAFGSGETAPFVEELAFEVGSSDKKAKTIKCREEKEKEKKPAHPGVAVVETPVVEEEQPAAIPPVVETPAEKPTKPAEKPAKPILPPPAVETKPVERPTRPTGDNQRGVHVAWPEKVSRLCANHNAS